MNRRDTIVFRRPALPGADLLAPEAPAPVADEPVREHVHEPQSALAVLREWVDALVFAFILAMFIRLFLVELFKIPTGSMTPTLIGGRVARIDYNQDGKPDLLLSRGDYQPLLLFLNDGHRLIGQGEVPAEAIDTSAYREQYDRILVNKFAYWFHPPRRGDIVVFKVPDRIWDPDKPIFIKRCVGEPGDILSFDSTGRLVANGQPVTQPEFFGTQRYVNSVSPSTPGFHPMPNVEYSKETLLWGIERIEVPTDQVYVFGDNTHSSLDSRYWGGVPLNHFKGRAFFRYWPWKQMKFLHNE